MKINNARWASEREVQSLENFLKGNNDEKSKFTNDWLLQNKDYFLKCYDNYPLDYTEQKQKEIDLLNERKLIEYYQKMEEFENLQNDVCICGHENILYYWNETEMVGCSNYKNTKFIHTRMFKPHYYLENKYILEHNTKTFDKLKTLYGLPVGLKVSILEDFVEMNGRKLYYEKKHIVLNNKIDSARREQMVKNILEENFDKIAHNKWIKYRLENGKEKYCQPDFVCKSDNYIYIIEQKKQASNIDKNQIELYTECIKIISNNSGINLPIKVIYIVEFDDKIKKNLTIIPFSKLIEYKFN
jgi:ssDNA-binding Zn-finger/Zn-ribbon topoisomerase 1